MSPITTHILDTAIGKPGANIAVMLEMFDGAGWQLIAKGETNNDGRIDNWLPANYPLTATEYRITFFLDPYFARHQRSYFYTKAEIGFRITNTNETYHVPALVSNYGLSTYRGS